MMITADGAVDAEMSPNADEHPGAMPHDHNHEVSSPNVNGAGE